MTNLRFGSIAALSLFCASLTACKPTAPTGGERQTPTPVGKEALEPPDDPSEDLPADGPSNSPVSLTASDGTGLTIVSFEARAVVEDPLAFTELHMIFHNPSARQVEGQFSITLPPSATLSRFAMKQSWGWQEGEVVELQAARQAYEDFLHRRQDPALLEKQPGNQFHARVFPIAASGDKEIILSYSEELTRAGEPYRVHLRGLPLLEKLDIHAVVGRHGKEGSVSSLGGTRYSYETVEVHKQKLQPDADFTVALPAITQQPQAGLRNGPLLVARLTPVTSAAPDPIDAQGGLYVLFDTSASRALGYAAQVARLGQVVAAIASKSGAETPLKIVAFDQGTADIYEGPMSGFDAAAQKKLLDRGALGASDLTSALAAAAKKGTRSYARMIVFTDGIATAGAIETAALKTAAATLSQSGYKRLDAIVSGGIRDAERLAALVTAGLPHDGVVLDAEKPPTAIARRLARATVSHLRVEVPHAKWVWPSQIDGIQPGDQVLVYAQMESPNGAVIVNIDGPAGMGGAATHYSYPVSLTDVEKPLLERSVVSAEIKRLHAQGVGADVTRSQALHKQIVELATKYRVLCDETALLVLETEEDYARFQIDRRALSDILTVGAGGIEILSRHGEQQLATTKLPPSDAPKPPAEKAKKEIALALDGNEGGGGGDGAKDSFRADSEPTAGKRMAATEAKEDPSAAMNALPPPPSPPPSMAAPSPVTAPRTQASASRDRRAGPRGGNNADDLVVAEPRAERSPPIPSPDSVAGGLVGNLSGGYAGGEKQQKIDPYQGKMKEVMDLLAAKKLPAAEAKARAWRSDDAGDVLALIALGEVLEKKGDRAEAARAYGSIIDLFPGRADLRRFAGERLEHLGELGLTLAIDTYKKARDQRPDHPASHRLLAFALLRAGDLEGAFNAIKDGAARSYPEGRFRGVERILREDVGLVAAVWVAREPKLRSKIESLVSAAGAQLATNRTLRFVLNWETDANDVDFHIFDAKGGHAFYSQPNLPSGGELYADVTTGYGPECFTIEGKPPAYPYVLQAHYYSRGPMGYGMGKLEIIEHDGQGGLRFEERPFVIMADNAFVDLGRVTGPLAASKQ